MTWLKLIPGWAWIGAAVVLGIWYYGNDQKQKGIAQERAIWQVAMEKEKARQALAAAEIIAEHEARADELDRQLAELRKGIDDAVEAARKTGGDSRIAIPADLLDRLRNQP